MDETRQVAEWIVNAKYGDFPQETIDCAKGLLLKTVTGMVIGSREPIGKTISNYLSRTSGPPVAGVTGGAFRTTVEDAAYAHGVFAHASELEDDEFPPTGDGHGNYWSFPAILSLAEDLFCDGREIIVSAILSWEILSRLTRAACAGTGSTANPLATPSFIPAKHAPAIFRRGAGIPPHIVPMDPRVRGC